MAEVTGSLIPAPAEGGARSRCGPWRGRAPTSVRLRTTITKYFVAGFAATRLCPKSLRNKLKTCCVNTSLTSLNINFLRKPAHKDVIGEAKLLKVGKRLAVGEITLFSDGDPEPVAHVACTYSIPPR